MGTRHSNFARRLSCPQNCMGSAYGQNREAPRRNDPSSNYPSGWQTLKEPILKPLNSYSDAAIYRDCKMLMALSAFVGFGVGYLLCRLTG